MLFKTKKKTEKKELLYRENIRVNCKAKTQEEVIKEVGQRAAKVQGKPLT